MNTDTPPPVHRLSPDDVRPGIGTTPFPGSSGRVVYVMWSGTRCLYVGQTKDLSARLRRHRQSQPWWPEVTAIDVEPLHGVIKGVDALRREAELIDELRPVHARPSSVINAMVGRA